MRLFEIEHALRREQARGIDEDVGRHVGERGGQGTFQPFPIRDVSLDRQCARAFRCVAIDQDRSRTRIGEMACHGAPDPRCRAGDYRHLAVETPERAQRLIAGRPCRFRQLDQKSIPIDAP
jgi:hypothetical protein